MKYRQKTKKLYDRVALMVSWPYEYQAKWEKRSAGYVCLFRWRGGSFKRWSGWVEP